MRLARKPRALQALCEALGRFVADPDLIVRLRRNIGPVKTLEQHVAELEALYA